MCYSTMVERDRRRIEREFSATTSAAAMEAFREIQASERWMSKEEIKNTLGLARAPRASQFRWAPDDESGRVYPGYFAPVMIMQHGKRTIVPMRYALRPAGSPKELKSQYALFNCRIDTLAVKPTWRKLLGRQHALFPFIKFYEWVEGPEGKPIQISFIPGDRPYMWAPALFDTWSSLDGKITFQSFAIVTDDPPPEILACGHDRCPIFLRADKIDVWLSANEMASTDALNILKFREDVHYCQEAAT